MAISERPDLRPTVCQALRTLIHKGCETDAERAEVGRFAKNFLPILFNVYSQPEEDGGTSAQRRSVLDTVRAYLTITDPQMVCGFLEKASAKLTSPESSEFARLSILDLVVAMAPYADEQSLDSLYRTIQPSLQPRLKCLFHIVKQLSAEHEPFVTALVPEMSEDGRLIIHEEEEELDDDEGKGADEEMADVLQDVGLRSKGKGDVKKKGQLDPYAYIPLNRAKLNRRKRAKMQGQFKGLMKGAQRGAKAGRRNRLKAQHS
ncbi:hypothetical protein EK904_000217 [Melospiza melodia maxima]|nr:hypothetical protein EK904_000217 [Melospiza melodia maxima]